MDVTKLRDYRKALKQLKRLKWRAIKHLWMHSFIPIACYRLAALLSIMIKFSTFLSQKAALVKKKKILGIKTNDDTS